MSKTKQETRLGEAIRAARHAAHLTQVGLAKALGERGFVYSEQAIANWETGRVTPPMMSIKGKQSLLDALAEALDIDKMKLLEAANLASGDEMLFAPDLAEIMAILVAATPSQRRTIKRVATELIKADV